MKYCIDAFLHRGHQPVDSTEEDAQFGMIAGTTCALEYILMYGAPQKESKGRKEDRGQQQIPNEELWSLLICLAVQTLIWPFNYSVICMMLFPLRQFSRTLMTPM